MWNITVRFFSFLTADTSVLEEPLWILWMSCLWLLYFSGTCPGQMRSISAVGHSQLHVPGNTCNFGSHLLPQVILEITWSPFLFRQRLLTENSIQSWQFLHLKSIASFLHIASLSTSQKTQNLEIFQESYISLFFCKWSRTVLVE